MLAFDIAQFFPSLNYYILTTILKKASFNANIVSFFISYLSNRTTQYTWESFVFPYFNVNIGVEQGSVLLPTLLALYFAPILYILKKRQCNLFSLILTSILSFINNSLIVVQEKDFNKTNTLLLTSYNMTANILINFDLTIKYNKSEVFHFSRNFQDPNSDLNL